jgi:hypothetical protein
LTAAASRLLLTRPEARRAARIRRVAGLALLVVVAAVSAEGWSGAFYLLGLHGSLGRAFWPALLASWGILLALVLPLALALAWPLSVGSWWRRYAPGMSIASLAVVLGALLSSARLARSAPTGAGHAPIDTSVFAPLAKLQARLPRGDADMPLLTAEPVACASSPRSARVTLVATFPRRSKRPRPGSVCIQADGLGTAIAQLRKTLLRSARRGRVAIDVVTGTQLLPARHGWLDALKLRPGLDGVCDAKRCLMPWQLLAHGYFSTYRPLDFIPDFQFGVAPERLREALGLSAGPSLAGLERVTTASFVLDLSSKEPAAVPLARMRRSAVELTGASLESGALAAERYVLAAQQPDGKFRYTLDPMSGVADVRSFNLARQAGTTLALCELGTATPEIRAAIERSLRAMLASERRRGEVHALTHDGGASVARLSESALPWVSLLACSQRISESFDEHIRGLANLILKLQNEDGGFSPAYDLEQGQVVRGREPLYATGQAVLGLLLLEHRLQFHPSAHLPPYEIVHEAAQRAMTYVATKYWSHPLRDFFFLEENWHCLAARQGLAVHRHAGYEAFCWDYVQFKARLILERERGIDPDFDGGFGFGNVVPPHNTGAAGFGEALSAAISVRRAQGRETASEEALLARVLQFLLRQQWTRDTCFACATPLVVGGMSEHTHSLVTRIDFAQHAWAAIGHGGRALGLLPGPD